jgi:tetratricopeptide (TPR) repeat protein
VTLWVFSSVLGNQFILFDDPDYITRNEVVQKGVTWEGVVWAFSAAHYANWHPLTWLSHMIDCQLFGLNPGGHHLGNVLFHTANVGLLFWVLYEMTGSIWKSLAVAVLFGWHPLRAESVAWAAERKDVLSGFFFLLSLLCYGRYVRSGKKAGGGGRYYGSALAFFALGLLAKPMVVTLPFVLVLLDYWPLHRFDDPFRDGDKLLALLKEKIPFFLLSVLSCIVTYLSQHGQGATSLINNFGLWPRLQNSLVSYVRYLEKTIWPENLSIFYPFPPHWWHPGIVLGSAMFLFVVTGIVLLLGKQHRFLLVGWFWYLGLLVPVIGLVQVGEQSMADRYSYLPTIGVDFLLVWSAAIWAGTLVWRRVLVGALVVSVAIACLLFTQNQIQVWKDGESVFQNAKEVTPPYYLTRLSLGIALMEKGRFSEAMEEYQAARRMHPRNPLIRHNLGDLQEKMGHRAEAYTCYRQALDIDPSYVLSRQALIRLLVQDKRYDDAETLSREALRNVSQDTTFIFMLGTIMVNKGDVHGSVDQFRKIIELKPTEVPARIELACALEKLGQLKEALEVWEQTIRLAPGNAEAQTHLGILYAQSGQLEAAVACFQKASQIEPGNEDYRFNLQTALPDLDKQRVSNLPNHVQP